MGRKKSLFLLEFAGFLLYFSLYNIFLAAKNAGVKRMVYASSIHAISGYPKHVQAKTTEPPNPGDLYGIDLIHILLLSNRI
jgi:nucleoside-diphosphate-sugar epimerase